MNQVAIFWPMIAHAALVYAVYVMIGLRRSAAVKSGSAKVSQFRENQTEPPQSLFVRNNLANQFELPMLFYAVCLSLYVTNGAGFTAVVIAWIFAISRFVHAYIHVTSNRIRIRQPAFMVGFIAVAVLWIMLAIHILAA